MNDKEFINLIDQNKKLIHKACNTYCESYPREDLFQEIIIEVFRSLDSFKKNCSFSTWIYNIARNKCISILRKQKNKPDIVGLDEYTETLIEMNNAPQMIKQLRQAIRYERVMDNIEEPYRTVFEMHLHGHSYKEIEQQTGVNENLLRQKIHRIKQRLYLRYGKSENIKS